MDYRILAAICLYDMSFTYGEITREEMESILGEYKSTLTREEQAELLNKADKFVRELTV